MYKKIGNNWIFVSCYDFCESINMFKLVIAVAFLSVALAAPQYFNHYQPYNPYRSYTPTPYFGVTPTPIVPVTAAPIVARVHVPSAESQAPILRQEQDVSEDGSYRYGYQTANGISAQETGGLKAVGPSVGTVAQGSYSYTSPEGKQIEITYIADEDGFRAVGDAIPTPPPLPPAIARALAYIAAHPQPAEPHYVQKYY